METTTNLSPEKSLQIISDVIATSRRNFEKESGNKLLIWGIVVAVTSAIVYLLYLKTGNPAWNFLWFILPACSLLQGMLTKKENRRHKNFMDYLVSSIWILFAIISVLTAILSLTVAKEMLPYTAALTIMPLGLSTAITGLVYKNYSIIAAGVITSLAGTVAAAMLPPVHIPAIIGVTAIISLIIPGTIIKIKSR